MSNAIVQLNHLLLRNIQREKICPFKCDKASLKKSTSNEEIKLHHSLFEIIFILEGGGEKANQFYIVNDLLFENIFNVVGRNEW